MTHERIKELALDAAQNAWDAFHDDKDGFMPSPDEAYFFIRNATLEESETEKQGNASWSEMEMNHDEFIEFAIEYWTALKGKA